MSHYKDYWNNNIDKWSDLYLEISHGSEVFSGSASFSKFYNQAVVPFEAKLMKERYNKTLIFINKYIFEGMRVSDIGCGTGIFTVNLLKHGAYVNAIDISEKSLEMTRVNVEKHIPEYRDRVSYFLVDAQTDSLPSSDAALCVGVLPYIEKTRSFMDNILDSTELLYFQFSSSFSPINLLRRCFSFLNVRKLNFQSLINLRRICNEKSFDITHNERFATGYLTLVQKRK